MHRTGNRHDGMFVYTEMLLVRWRSSKSHIPWQNGPTESGNNTTCLQLTARDTRTDLSSYHAACRPNESEFHSATVRNNCRRTCRERVCRAAVHRACARDRRWTAVRFQRTDTYVLHWR